ncbi:hypothetical protein ACOMHN_003525 [Nucella lapillus]
MDPESRAVIPDTRSAPRARAGPSTPRASGHEAGVCQDSITLETCAKPEKVGVGSEGGGRRCGNAVEDLPPVEEPRSSLKAV